jgi:kynureninase
VSSAGFSPDAACARSLDAGDELARLRRAFALPKASGRTLNYLCGHSLGPMPKRARGIVDGELDRWARDAVAGHFGRGGWLDYHERFSAPLADLVGARRDEVVAMNTLTVNLHLMLVSFFTPGGNRRRILIERGAFPSDRYAVRSHLEFHGLDAERDLVELAAEPGTARLDPAQLEHVLEAQGDRIALVLLPGVQYLTGQALDLDAYAAVARRHGCRIGFDLAHAIGNVPIALGRSGADFAVWCGYKYLCGGPGAVGGCFVNRRWSDHPGIPRFAGWWGHEKASRFAMPASFSAIAGAEGWQLSNPPILSLAPLAAALDVFRDAGKRARRRKSLRLGEYLVYLLDAHLPGRFELLTPMAARDRGCQISLRLKAAADTCRRTADRLRDQGVVVDWRPPDVLRIAPMPLYNRYRDVYAAVRALKRALDAA